VSTATQPLNTATGFTYGRSKRNVALSHRAPLPTKKLKQKTARRSKSLKKDKRGRQDVLGGAFLWFAGPRGVGEIINNGRSGGLTVFCFALRDVSFGYNPQDETQGVSLNVLDSYRAAVIPRPMLKNWNDRQGSELLKEEDGKTLSTRTP
jgi:hypothetical protein